ncbi:sigma-70 family RNA polymerase sigma factor [bacterium SCSIO 12643]|nr:sigma-70 family RNA polymerase sigma factor [bacterium SCSIO 12643]
MFNTAIRIVKDGMIAEELMQDGFMTAFTKMDKWHQKSSFGAWLKRVVINECLDYLAKKKLDTVSMEEMQISDTEEEILDEPDYDVAEIKKAMSHLPDGYRAILSLYLFEGYDHEEISEIMKITSSTSRSQYLRAKKKLIELINKKEYVG